MFFTRNQFTNSSIVAVLFLSILSCWTEFALSQESVSPKFVAPRFLDSNVQENQTVPEEQAKEPENQLVIPEETDDSDNVGIDSSIEEAESTTETGESLLLEDGTEDTNSTSNDVEENNEGKDEASTVDSSAMATVETDVIGTRNGDGVERAPYDVYKENGIYFEGWEKPELALIFTGMTNGYIEPCGCAGMERMKGGLSRRCTFLNQLRNDMGWNTVAIDTGQITVGFGVQEELKFDMAMNAFQLMEYDAIGIGKGELRFPASFLLTFTTPTSATSQSLFTSANIGVYGYHQAYTLPYKIVEKAGKRIGVVSVVCEDDSVARRDESLLYEAPEKKLLELLPKLKKEAFDTTVLIVHGTDEESSELAKKFPLFDYIVTADTPSEPPAELKMLNDKQGLVEVGEKGKYAVVIGFYADGSKRYQRVALDSRYESSPEITLLMKDYQSILKNLIVNKGFRGGLGVNPARSPKAELLGTYVGSKKCRSCHEEEYRVWSKSKHASAWKSLKETANPPRDFDPECIGCHVIGWDGLQRFPFVDGYASEEKTPELLNVGCESCHGPGSLHTKAEVDDNEKVQEKIRAGLRIGKNVKKVCYSCHDGDNSPEFDFDTYYPLVQHTSESEEDVDDK